MWEHIRRAAGLFVFTAAASAIGGCASDDGFGKRYAVTGTVTYRGEPLKKGKVYFSPEKADAPAGNAEVEDGRITNVTTVSPGDGLLAGKYAVTVTAVEDVNLDAVTKKFKSAPDPVALTRAASKARSLVPKKYARAATSGLTAEVSPDHRSFVFELND